MFDSTNWFWVAFWLALGLLCAIAAFFGGPPLVFWLIAKGKAFWNKKKEEAEAKEQEKDEPEVKKAAKQKKEAEQN